VIRSLRERAVYHHLPLKARQKLICIPSDFGKTSLGLEPAIYSEIASEITGLIHCAWSVNFNLGLGSFEADCIAGAHNLITLCLKSQRPTPATFNFCSSVSAVAATKGGFVPEALPESLEYAQNMGYAQSKLITEHICGEAAKSHGIKTRVLRVGQVVADTVHGIWNATEAIPLMMQAGLTIGAIPRLDENPLWLPVDVVASTISNISLSDASDGVMNIVNHQSFHWTRDLLPALHRAGLEFSEPSQKEWVDLLRKSDPDPVANPPIKLLDFFASKYDNDLPRKGLTYDTSFARFLSPSLAAAPVLDQQLVDKLVKQFQATSWATITPSLTTKRLIVIAGPCGSGKSTVAKAVSKQYDIPWIEGDNLHSEASIAKMSAGTPLSDEDRWLWLETIKATALLQLRKEKRSNIIVTCSALKQVYRAELRQSRGLKIVFVMLQGSQDILKHRVTEREGHFMSTKMVQSQLDSLEAPGLEETDVIPVDVTVAKQEVLAEVLNALKDLIVI
jgi:carbohydrate kinase (thermoresistant glucokinase family)